MVVSQILLHEGLYEFVVHASDEDCFFAVWVGESVGLLFGVLNFFKNFDIG